MSTFLDELFEGNENSNDHEEVEVVETTEVEEAEGDEDTSEDGDSEEVAEVEEPDEASEGTDTESDDDKEMTPGEKKAYGRLKALQDERDKRRSADDARKLAEAERDRLNAELAEMRRQQQELANQNLPDPYENPEDYIRAREAQMHQEMVRQNLGHSISRAVDRHGQEEVEAAARWFEQQIASNPSMPLRDNMLAQPDQMEYVVNSYKQASKMNAFASGDISTIVAELQKAGYTIAKAQETPTGTAPIAPVTQTAPVAPAKTQAPAAPKRSKLANTSTATVAAPKELSMMDDVLSRK